MAGTIIVSSIKTDTDNSFIVRSNTGATLFSVDTTSISIPDGSITSAMIANGTVIAADILDGTITTAKIADGNVTNAKIDSVANTKITGLVTAAQIANVANTQITGNITQSQIATGVAGTGPAFSAYQSSAQTLSSGVVTKIQLQTEEWDTASCFDNSTNYRFTPNIAGYYQINGGIQVNATVTVISVFLYKNGSLYKFLATTNTATLSGAYGSSLVYLNGTTDYVELYASAGIGQALNVNGTAGSWFNGAMVRSA